MIVELLGSGVTEGVVSTNPKRFTCLLSQTGTNAPTTNILENTLGLTFTASYSFIGGYTFNITSTPLYFLCNLSVVPGETVDLITIVGLISFQ